MRRTLLLAGSLLLSLLSACADQGGRQPSPSAPVDQASAPLEVADAGPPDSAAPADSAPEAGDAGPSDAAPVDGEAAPTVDPSSLDGSASTSIGGPSEGHLEGGVPFPSEAPGIILNPRRLNPGGHYGTVEMIQALLRAAKVVEEALPGGPPVIVNDLGFEKGGPIPHHGSHQAGRDVDVLFYLLDSKGDPRPGKGVPLDPRGRGWDFGDLADPSDDLFVKLDERRSWRFLQALAEDDASLIQRVFLAEHLRTILLKEAERAKAPRAARQLIGDLTCQPNTPHDDHFHFRFFCTAEDLVAGCEDSPPIYPWRRAQLKVAGLSPKISRPRPAPRSRSKARTVSQAEAASKAGKLHWKVTAFLKQRETWSKLPHPGRTYCR